MSKKQNPMSRLSPAQLLLALAFLIILAAIQVWSQRDNPDATHPPVQTIKTTAPPEPQPGSPSTSVFSPQLPTTQTPGMDAPALEPPGEFDYFLLALSWSPDYCATSGSDDPQQCSIGRKLGFVLHGLWPQYERGYPSNCSTEKMTAAVKAQFPGLYPSQDLYDHEWEKHGTCTGLSTSAYLTLSGQIKASVVIPDAYRSPEAPFRTNSEKLKTEFTRANPTFPASAFAVNCSGSGRYLKELQVCFSKAGQPTACSAEVLKSAQKSCQSPDFLVRNIR